MMQYLVICLFVFLPLALGQRCPYGWEMYSSGQTCVILKMGSTKNYHEAQTDCKGYDALTDLVVIKDDAMNAWLGNLVKNTQAMFLIGLHDQGTEDKFYWVNGDELYLQKQNPNWNVGEPNNAGGEDCVEIVGSNKWNDISCNKASNFICQRPNDVPLECDENQGWRAGVDSCLKYFDSEQRSWSSARQYCQDREGDLLQIDSDDEQSLIHSVSVAEQWKTVWIGLTDQIKNMKGQYSWVDGSDLGTVMYWAANQPNNNFFNNGGNCAEILNSPADGKWTTAACTDKKQFACEKSKGTCAPGWRIHGGQCYNFYTNTPMTWSVAKHTCEAHGGFLVSIQSEDENYFLAKQFADMSDLGIDWLWMGASDSESDGVFKWADGTSIGSYNKWLPNQPQNTQYTDCGYFDTADSEGKWTAGNCFEVRPFICEIKAGEKVYPIDPNVGLGKCKPGWNLFEGNCYFFDTSMNTYDEARQKCIDKNTQLTSILDDTAQSYLSMRTYTFQVFLWIGLNDKAQKNVFVWEDGSPYNYTYWAPGQPDHYGNNEKCVHFRYGELQEGMWNDLPCSSKQAGYICKTKAEAGVPSTAKPPPTPTFNDRCGSGWEYDTPSKQCYLFKPGDLRTWQTAREQCMLGGGDLVSITELSDQTYLTARLALETSIPVIWIGANDILKEGGWEWSDGSPFKFLNWASGEPNNVGTSGEHCAEFKIGSGYWNDVTCTNTIGYVCKKDGYLVSHYSAYPNMYLDITGAVIISNSYPETCAFSCVYSTPPYTCLSFNYDRKKKECLLLDSTKDLVGGLKASVDKDYYEIRSDAPPPYVPVTLPPNYRCPADWQGYGDYCYQTRDEVTSWADARTSCRQSGADLISLRDANENQYMVSIMHQATNPGDVVEFWIGLNDNQVSLSYEWSDDSAVLYTNWYTNEPDNYNGKNEDCVETYTDGFWNDQDCTDQNRYICKMMKQDLPATQYPVTPSGCDQGWIPYEASCYLIEDQKEASWSDALTQCQSYGGSLVTITNRFEQSVITSQLGQQLWSKLFWIGLHDQNTKGFYEWAGGAALAYDNWAKGQPDSTKGDCVYAVPGVSAGLWAVGLCSISTNYVCEKGRAGYTTVKVPTVKTTPTNTNCAPGWVGYGSRCFKPFDLNPLLSFWNAETFCLNMGGHLASFGSKTEEDYIVEEAEGIIDNTDASYWIGLHDTLEEGGFEWLDGRPVGWTNWAAQEPNNAGSGEDCTEMFFNGHGWNDLDCLSNKRNAVCMLPKGQMPATTLPPVTQKQCPTGEDGYFLFKDYCYYLSLDSDQKGWTEAEETCHLSGGHLASIHGQDEQDYLYDQVTSAGRGDFWIGLREFTKNGIYKWSDDSALDYDAWLTGEPNDSNGEEECVEMYPRKDDTTGGNWNDQNCGTPRNYICKKAADSVVPITHAPTPAPKGYCPQNSVLFLNRCYVFYGSEPDSKMNWRNASKECKKTPGSELATIHSAAVQAMLTSFLDRVDFHLWIGLSDVTTNRQFKWIDGTSVDYTNWLPGKPNEANEGEDCVEMSYDWARAGRWNDNKCSQLNGYICKSKPDMSNNPPLTPLNPCHTGFSYWPKTTSCFRIDPKPRVYSAAVTACHGLGNRPVALASLNDPYEAAFANWLAVDAAADSEGNIGEEQPIWIGMVDDKVAGEYRWVDNWPILYTNWASSEPSKGSGEGCVAMNFDGKWDDTVCDNNYGSLCKYSLAPAPTLHPDEQGTCPDDWTPSGGSCYFFPPADGNLLSQYSAQGECSKIGADLVSLQSQVENQFVRSTIWAIRTYPIWIGLFRSDEGGFQWQDFTPVSFVYWATGEPSYTWDGQHENCVAMYTDTGQWNDIDCNQLRNYVCKKPKTPPPTKKPTAGLPNTPKPLTGLDTGVIVGIVLAVLVAILLVAMVLVFYVTRNRHQKGPVIGNTASSGSGDAPGFDNAAYYSTGEDKPELPEHMAASPDASNA